MSSHPVDDGQLSLSYVEGQGQSRQDILLMEIRGRSSLFVGLTGNLRRSVSLHCCVVQGFSSGVWREMGGRVRRLLEGFVVFLAFSFLPELTEEDEFFVFGFAWVSIGFL